MAFIRGEAHIRGRRLFQRGYPKLRLFLEGGAYLRPGTYWRSHLPEVLSKGVLWKYSENLQENTHTEVWFQLLGNSVKTLITVSKFKVINNRRIRFPQTGMHRCCHVPSIWTMFCLVIVFLLLIFLIFQYTTQTIFYDFAMRKT